MIASLSLNTPRRRTNLSLTCCVPQQKRRWRTRIGAHCPSLARTSTTFWASPQWAYTAATSRWSGPSLMRCMRLFARRRHARERSAPFLVSSLVGKCQGRSWAGFPRHRCYDHNHGFFPRILPAPSSLDLIPNTPQAAVSELIESWALTLPRLLWEAGNSALKTATLIVEALGTIGRRSLRTADGSSPLLDKVQPRLALYFFARSKGRSVYGPFIEVRKPVQPASTNTHNPRQH